MPPSPTTLRRAFADICRGYSSGLLNGVAVYTRHLSHQQHIELDLYRERFESEAREQGAPTEGARLAELIKKGQWSDGKENEIARQKDTAQRFEEAKRGLVKPSEIAAYDRQIKDENDRLVKLLNERRTLIGATCEEYAQHRLDDHYIVTNLFSDSTLTCPVFSADEYDSLPDSTIQQVIDLHRVVTDPLSDHNLRHLAIQDFFIGYYILCADDLYSFFGRPIVEMTHYQVRLGNVARYFKSILEHTDTSKLPPDARTNPDKLESFHTAQRNNDQMRAAGQVPTGMTAEDSRALGYEGKMSPLPKTNLSGEDFARFLMKQGG